MAVAGHQFLQHRLAPVAEGRMSQVMGQCDGLDKVFVESQCPPQTAGDLCDLQRVGHPRAKVVVLVGDEDLRLEVQPSERSTMHDPVPVALEAGAVRMFLLGVLSSPAFRLGHRAAAQPGLLARLVEKAGTSRLLCHDSWGRFNSAAAWSTCPRSVSSRMGITVAPSNTGMKLVSPLQRGTTWA